MSDAVYSLIGTIIGSLAGILVSNKLTAWRLEQLEKKLDKYADSQDDMKLRLIRVEDSTKSAHHRLDDIIEQLNIHERRK